MIKEHINKENLHHAYLIEGETKIILPELFEVIGKLGVKTSGNPDFCHIAIDTFKIEDARSLKSLTSESGITKSKKVFVISTNNLLLEAQNALLKLFEEPIPETHFFLILPNTNILLKTFSSRFYKISASDEPDEKDAKKFIDMGKAERISFLRELLEDEENARARANKFINELESYLHSTGRLNLAQNIALAEQIFKVREYLHQPGSSAKNLLESIALVL